MKEKTKDRKAIEEFRDIATRCAKFGNYSDLVDKIITIGGNKYRAHVQMENGTATIYQVVDEFNSIEIGTIPIK